MIESQNTSKDQKLNILRSEVFTGISIDLQNNFLSQLPWVISLDMTVAEAVERLDKVALNTLFVLGDEDKLVGIITKNPELIKGCKKGGGPSTSNQCQQLCDSKCADRGGCAFVLWDPWGGNTKCRYECNDQFDQTQTVGETWF